MDGIVISSFSGCWFVNGSMSGRADVGHLVLCAVCMCCLCLFLRSRCGRGRVALFRGLKHGGMNGHGHRYFFPHILVRLVNNSTTMYICAWVLL